MGALEEANKRKRRIVKALNKWAINNLRDFPWRRNTTPYRVLIAEFLLRRTTAAAVNRVFEKFFDLYPSIGELANANSQELEILLETLGYHKQRSRIIKETCEFILDRFGGKIPKDMESLTRIPNIGPYTAGAILSLGFEIRAPMVDSNVDRILRRVFSSYLPNHSVNRTIKGIAERLLPKVDHQTHNLALIDLGATVCTYRKIHCTKCPLKAVCDHFMDGRNT